MAQYIEKDALVEEIKRLEKISQEYKKTWKWRFKWFYRTIIGRLEVLEGLKNYIDTLEAKEVDLKKEIQSMKVYQIWNDWSSWNGCDGCWGDEEPLPGIFTSKEIAEKYKPKDTRGPGHSNHYYIKEIDVVTE